VSLAAIPATVLTRRMSPSSFMLAWPESPTELVAAQRELARSTPPPWEPPAVALRVGACFVCFQRGDPGPGAKGDAAWAAAVVVFEGRVDAGAPYEPGLLALREGALLETAVRKLGQPPDVLLVDATGRDHPRGAGLALHLGAVLEIPTVGVTHRPLAAEGDWPRDERGATSALTLSGEVVGYWVRTRRGARPLAVHAAWRTDGRTAVEVVLATTHGTRTPEPLREARRLARSARAGKLAAVSP
jgi:deoxyribonuclease V